MGCDGAGEEPRQAEGEVDDFPGPDLKPNSLFSEDDGLSSALSSSLRVYLARSVPCNSTMSYAPVEILYQIPGILSMSSIYVQHASPAEMEIQREAMQPYNRVNHRVGT